MNTQQQQAYIEGFTKRASEYGLNHNEAIELLKQANRLREAILSGEVSPENAGGLTPELLNSFDETSEGVFKNRGASKSIKGIADQINNEASVHGAGKKIKDVMRGAVDKAPTSSYIESEVAPRNLMGPRTFGLEKERLSNLEKILFDKMHGTAIEKAPETVLEGMHDYYNNLYREKYSAPREKGVISKALKGAKRFGGEAASALEGKASGAMNMIRKLLKLK
jgi:hypothetical protein